MCISKTSSEKVTREKKLDFLTVVNFLTDPGSPAIKFLKTGLTYSHILS